MYELSQDKMKCISVCEDLLRSGVDFPTDPLDNSQPSPLSTLPKPKLICRLFYLFHFFYNGSHWFCCPV